MVRDISEKNKLLEELISASREDPLTKLFNRRYFSQLLEQEISRYKRYKRPFCLVMIDIDHFKSINDKFGHICGDLVLTNLTDKIIEAVRETDQVGRWGGEEFLILLTETTLAGGIEITEKLRSQIEKMTLNFHATELSLTVSIGLCVFSEQYQNEEDIIKAVDDQLYRAKREGRNKACY